MPIYLYSPSAVKLAQLHRAQAQLEFSYTALGASQAEVFPSGYHHDRYQCLLGEGEACWQAAKAALSQWQMFPAWARPYPEDAPQVPEQEVLVQVQWAGVHWLNGARIVYCLDEAQRFGFAYGTLISHAEQGEELFMVSRDDNGQVFFELRAFSLPRHWLARLGAPLVRRLQKRFARDAQLAMQRVVTS